MSVCAVKTTVHAKIVQEIHSNVFLINTNVKYYSPVTNKLEKKKKKT